MNKADRRPAGSRRIMIAVPLIAALIAALAGCGSNGETESGKPLRKITFNLAYFPQGSTGGVFAAIDQGFYKAEGLDVEAVRGYGGTRTVNEIDQGKWDFGYGDPVSVILNRAAGGKAVMVGALNTVWPGGLCYDAGKHQINTLQDLKGLVLGGGATSPIQSLLPVWLEANGLPRDHVKLLKMDPAVVDTSFIQGKTDLDDCWAASNRANVLKLAEQAGKNVKWIEYRDHKLDMYGNGIVTSAQKIQQDPAVVKAFLRATYKGYAYMRDNPDKVAEYISSKNPQLDPKVLTQQATDMNKLINDPRTASQGPGWFDAARMKSTVETIRRAFKVEREIAPSDVYTNDHLK
ncbi:ABC transporter substrate-binding protein [Actinomadura sp. 1N219]|uniref:ABC transporter substrate-binding protein n=1 Tax=Actinomadura sp. 1N219 TaxID=3375152 RepID=UPI0037B8B0E4